MQQINEICLPASGMIAPDAKIRGQSALTCFIQPRQFSCCSIVPSIWHNLSIFLNCCDNSACGCGCVWERGRLLGVLWRESSLLSQLHSSSWSLFVKPNELCPPSSCQHNKMRPPLCCLGLLRQMRGRISTTASSGNFDLHLFPHDIQIPAACLCFRPKWVGVPRDNLQVHPTFYKKLTTLVIPRGLVPESPVDVVDLSPFLFKI